MSLWIFLLPWRYTSPQMTDSRMEAISYSVSFFWVMLSRSMMEPAWQYYRTIHRLLSLK